MRWTVLDSSSVVGCFWPFSHEANKLSSSCRDSAQRAYSCEASDRNRLSRCRLSLSRKSKKKSRQTQQSVWALRRWSRMVEVRTVLPQPANPCSHRCRRDPDFHWEKAWLLINQLPVPPRRFSLAALRLVEGSEDESHLLSLSRWPSDFSLSTPAFV